LGGGGGGGEGGEGGGGGGGGGGRQATRRFKVLGVGKGRRCRVYPSVSFPIIAYR